MWTAGQVEIENGSGVRAELLQVDGALAAVP